MSTTFSLTEYVCSQSLIHHKFNGIVYLYGDKASLYSTLCSFLRKWWWFEYILRSAGKRSTVHILSLPYSYKCKQEKCSERWLRYLLYNYILTWSSLCRTKLNLHVVRTMQWPLNSVHCSFATTIPVHFLWDFILCVCCKCWTHWIDVFASGCVLWRH